MTSKDFLKVELKKINEIFTTATFRYEFLNSEQLHIIDVRPLSIFDTDEFLDHRIELKDKLAENYPAESILFLSEDSLNKIDKVEFVICKQTKTNIASQIFKFALNSCLSDYTTVGENNYAQAA